MTFFGLAPQKYTSNLQASRNGPIATFLCSIITQSA